MEKFTGYQVKILRDTNIYSLTYGDEKKDMVWNPQMCPPDSPTPPEPTDKKEQSIVWNQQITDVYVDESVELIAYATSELPVTFRIAEGADKAHMLGNMLVCDAEGLVVVVAEQEGNDEYYPALDVLKSFNIKHQEIVKKPQTITWNQNFDVKEGDMLQLNAVASSGLPITYRVVSGNEHVSLENNVITAISEGSVVISAHQFGNDEYEAAEAVTKGFYVEKGVVPTGKSWIKINVVGYSTESSEIRPLPINPIMGEPDYVWDDRTEDVNPIRAHLRQGLNIINFDTIPANTTNVVHIYDANGYGHVFMLWVDLVEVYVDDNDVENLANFLGGLRFVENGTFRIVNWNAPNVTDMKAFMYNVMGKNMTFDLSAIDTSNVNDLSYAFDNFGSSAINAETLILDGWNIGKDCNVNEMFSIAWISKLYIRNINDTTNAKFNEALEKSPTNHILEIITE